MPQQQRKFPLSVALLSLSVVSHSAMAGVTQDVEDALNFYHYGKNGAVKIDLNTRYENVNQGSVRSPALRGNPLPAGISWPARLCRISGRLCHGLGLQ